MQRAIPQRRMTIVLLAIVAAVATVPFIGANSSAHGANAKAQRHLCPPIC